MSPAGTSRGLHARNLGFFVFWASSVLVFHEPIRVLTGLAWNDERYTHTVLMPLLSVILIFLRRRAIFLHSQYRSAVGIPIVVTGIVLFCLSTWWSLSAGSAVTPSLEILAMTIIWIGAFVIFYGTRSFTAALFPLFLLLFTVPIPASVVEMVEVALQKGSAEITEALFRMTATPVFREGLRFSLPGVTIEVARECSGIRSGIALLITALVLSHLFLRSGWRRAVVVLSTVPIAIFKNAVRIAMLSWLGAYVSKSFLFGDLHHRGGPVFSLLSLAVLVPLVFALQRSEGRPTAKGRTDSDTAGKLSGRVELIDLS